VGDYHALPQENGGRALVRTPTGIELISNVCRHRQAIMLKGAARCDRRRAAPAATSSARCTAGPTGQRRAAGRAAFRHDPCLNLNNYRLREWNGLLFEDNGRDIEADLRHMGRAPSSTSRLVLDHVEMHECNYNWKTFIEVYLEDYHVGPFHPGLGNFVTCDDLRGNSEHYSVQTVGVASGFSSRARRVPALARGAAQVPRGKLPERGAIWLTYYPHIMVEWYPHVLTVSTLHPISPQKTLNVVEFYYPEEIAAFEREFVEAQQAAYMETCIEDDEIGERMDAGRRPCWSAATTRSAPTRARWKTACSTSTSGTARPWAASPQALKPGRQMPAMTHKRPAGRFFVTSSALARTLRSRPLIFSKANPMQAMWMVVAAFFFASMGVCVKIASNQFNAAEWCSTAACWASSSCGPWRATAASACAPATR
jgi:choline monooxygenase